MIIFAYQKSGFDQIGQLKELKFTDKVKQIYINAGGKLNSIRT